MQTMINFVRMEKRNTMGKYLLFLCLSFLGGGVFDQETSDFFLPLTWEQASAMAIRENKLVLVEVGDVGEMVRKRLEVMDFLQRQTIAIRMDMDTPQGKVFESRLLFYPYPSYAFFMPYGDLVGIVMLDELANRPERLREVLEEAKAMAQEKKRNSRSVRFVEESLEETLAQAVGKKRNLFVYVADETKQASWLMEKNVFTLDRVADFYNRHFDNVYLNIQAAIPWMRQFEMKETPAFLFLNGEGKLLLQAAGYCDAERLLAYGAKVLEKEEQVLAAEGVAGMTEKYRSEVRDTALMEKDGTESFVKDGQFDEEAFKQYARRLKKEKVEGWRLIVRNTRMDAAEQVGDWKTYILLAEEKWHEEEITDGELYRWAQKIERQCRDGNVRYKMAQWLTQRVREINRKECLTGKVDLTSYRGFFEKMADDLLKEVK